MVHQDPMFVEQQNESLLWQQIVCRIQRGQNANLSHSTEFPSSILIMRLAMSWHIMFRSLQWTEQFYGDGFLCNQEFFLSLTRHKFRMGHWSDYFDFNRQQSEIRCTCSMNTWKHISPLIGVVQETKCIIQRKDTIFQYWGRCDTKRNNTYITTYLNMYSDSMDYGILNQSLWCCWNMENLVNEKFCKVSSL